MGDRLDPKIDMALDDVITSTRSPSQRHGGRSRYSGLAPRNNHHRDHHSTRSSEHGSQRRVQGGRISVPARSVGRSIISTEASPAAVMDPVRSSLSVSNLHHEVTEDDLAVLDFTVLFGSLL